MEKITEQLANLTKNLKVNKKEYIVVPIGENFYIRCHCNAAIKVVVQIRGLRNIKRYILQPFKRHLMNHLKKERNGETKGPKGKPKKLNKKKERK